MSKLMFLILIFTFANVFAEEAKPKCHLGYKVIDGIKPCTGYIAKSTINLVNLKKPAISSLKYKEKVTGIDFRFYSQDGTEIIPIDFVTSKREYTDPKLLFYSIAYKLEGQYEPSVVFALDKKFQIENIRPVKDRPLKIEKLSREKTEELRQSLVDKNGANIGSQYPLKKSKDDQLFYTSEFESYLILYPYTLKKNESYEKHKFETFRYFIYNKDGSFINQFWTSPGRGEVFFNPLFKFDLYGIEYLLVSSGDYRYPLVDTLSLYYKIGGKSYWVPFDSNEMLPFDLDKK